MSALSRSASLSSFPLDPLRPTAFALSRIAVARGKSDQRQSDVVWRKDVPLLVATSFEHSLSARASQSNTSLQNFSERSVVLTRGTELRAPGRGAHKPRAAGYAGRCGEGAY